MTNTAYRKPHCKRSFQSTKLDNTIVKYDFTTQCAHKTVALCSALAIANELIRWKGHREFALNAEDCTRLQLSNEPKKRWMIQERFWRNIIKQSNEFASLLAIAR